MKHYFVAFCLVTVLLMGVLAHGQALPDGAEIMARYAQATGGADAYAKIENRVTEYRFAIPAQGFEMKIASWFARPNKVCMVMESDALGRIEKGSDGMKAWEYSLLKGARLLSGAEKEDLLREAVLDKYIDWQRYYAGVACTGLDTLDGEPCYRCELTAPDGKVQTLYFMRDSGFLTRLEMVAETEMGRIPVQTLVSDYRQVDGLWLPFKTNIRIMGQERVITVTSIAHNQSLAADRFAPPQEVATLIANAN